jgi:hypothetical protein
MNKYTFASDLFYTLLSRQNTYFIHANRSFLTKFLTTSTADPAPITEAMATSLPPIQTQNLQPHHLSTNHTNTRQHSPQSRIITNMFGALNRFISRLDAAPEEQQSATNGAYGFQVLRNTNADVPLDPWFDFVIGINGRTIVCLIVGGWRGEEWANEGVGKPGS